MPPPSATPANAAASNGSYDSKIHSREVREYLNLRQVFAKMWDFLQRTATGRRRNGFQPATNDRQSGFFEPQRTFHDIDAYHVLGREFALENTLGERILEF